jgi:hypothetical protein
MFIQAGRLYLANTAYASNNLEASPGTEIRMPAELLVSSLCSHFSGRFPRRTHIWRSKVRAFIMPSATPLRNFHPLPHEDLWFGYKVHVVGAGYWQSGAHTEVRR